jgi:hypothetical protein
VDPRIFETSKIYEILSHHNRVHLHSTCSLKKREHYRLDTASGFSMAIEDESNLRLVQRDLSTLAFCPFLFKRIRELDSIEEFEIINSFMETKMPQRLFTSHSILQFNCQKISKRQKLSDAARFAMRRNNLEVGGNSGRFYYSTDNNMFIVLTVTNAERKTLVRNIRSIFDHLKYNQSILRKYYGAFYVRG